MRNTLLFLSMITISAPAVADGWRSHEAARAAVEAGEIAPLGRILDAADRDFGGTMLEVELEREHGRWIYEVKLLLRDGRVVKVDYDARDAVLVRKGDR